MAVATLARRVASLTSIVRTRSEDAAREERHGGSTREAIERYERAAERLEKIAEKLEGKLS